MTTQVPDSIVLNGEKISISNYPDLPKNHKKIKKMTAKQIEEKNPGWVFGSTACWRRYIATWQIIDNKLFLINIVGHYYLKGSEPLHAEWFTGKIKIPTGKELFRFHMGFGAVHEKDIIYEIECGFVKKRYFIKNREKPFNIPYRDEIKQFISEKNIDYLIHFTAIENIPSILEYGLIGRNDIVRGNIKSIFNDKYRYDNLENSICTSISFPNYKMFFTLQNSNPDQDWAIVRLDPRILYEIPCAFFYTNAASNLMTNSPLEDKFGINAFNKIFGDNQPGIKREQLNIPDCYSTDPQAEVLVLESIDTSYIVDIYINSEGKIKNKHNVYSLIAPYHNFFNFFSGDQLFTYRKDYDFWRKKSVASDEVMSIVEKLFK